MAEGPPWARLYRKRSLAALGMTLRAQDDRLAPPLEIEIAAHRQQPLEPLPHHLERRPVAEAAVGGADPAVGEVAVLREQYPERLVDAEQVPGAGEQVGAVAEGLALAVAG